METYGKPMEIYENLWKSMKIYGKPMKIYGKPMKTYGNL